MIFSYTTIKRKVFDFPFFKQNRNFFSSFIIKMLIKKHTKIYFKIFRKSSCFIYKSKEILKAVF